MVKPILILSLTFLILAAAGLVAAIEDDVKCLEGLKKSLNDPQGKLDSWIFTNISVEFVCKQLVGVSCWNEKESRIISLQLPSMGLTGQLPDSLQYCSSLQNLDLSGNQLSGSIPSRICNWLPYLTTLDLSANAFSNSIPPEIANCRFVNNLILGDNQLSGQIPYGLVQLDRIRKFSVANNKLSGSIPSDLANLPADGFTGNSGLCGKPLSSKCGKLSSKNLAIIIAAGVLGAVGSLLLALLLWRWCFLPSMKKKKNLEKEYETHQSSWIRKLKAHKLEQVSLFQKPLVKVRLNDLIAATNNFDFKNIIMTTKTGVTFKAILPDGSALAIKRFSSCKLNERLFVQNMNTLGKLRHPNLVPLLGFCVVEDERLLVYKHMPNLSLYSFLHETPNSDPLDWPGRLRIAIGAARGLAWLHHGCQPPYIHQHISSRVILIDDDFESRISDFGLATLVGSDNPNQLNVNLGEFGYVAPEYSSTMVSSRKGDVYAFGVVLIELVTRQKPLEVVIGGEEERFKGTLVDWINQLYVSGRIKDGIDKSLVGRGFDDDEILQVLNLGRRCLVSGPKDRPSMRSVYQSLKAIGMKHGFSQQFEDELDVGEEEDDHE